MGPSDGLVKYTSLVVYINTFKINTCPTYLFKYEFAGYGFFFHTIIIYCIQRAITPNYLLN